MQFWKFQILEKCPGPILQKPEKRCFEKSGFARIQNPTFSNPLNYLTITAYPISHFFTETFDLLSAGQFENLVFRPQSQGGQICVSWAHPLGPRRRRRQRQRRRRTNSQIQIQAPPNAPRDEILPRGNPRC